VELIAGDVKPRRRCLCGHLIEHLGTPPLTPGWTTHGWPHAGVATANPPGSAAASQPVRSHTRARTAPSRTGRQGIPCGWPVAGRAAARAAGILAAPAIRGSRAAGPVKGGKLIYLNSRK
jgi:hypothetical protein